MVQLQFDGAAVLLLCKFMTKKIQGFSLNYFSPENPYIHSQKKEFKTHASSP